MCEMKRRKAWQRDEETRDKTRKVNKGARCKTLTRIQVWMSWICRFTDELKRWSEKRQDELMWEKSTKEPGVNILTRQLPTSAHSCARQNLNTLHLHLHQNLNTLDQHSCQNYKDSNPLHRPHPSGRFGLLTANGQNSNTVPPPASSSFLSCWMWQDTALNQPMK